MKHLRTAVVLLMVVVLAAGCAWPRPKTAELVWTGSALEGAVFEQREQGMVVVHYTAPTSSERAEQAMRSVAGYAARLQQAGRLMPADRVDLWLVPDGLTWPRGLPAPPPGRLARAAAPLAVVATEAAVSGMADSGLQEALAVAAAQPAGSPVFSVDWLHEGTGQVLLIPAEEFPAAPWRSAREPLQQAYDMLQRLQTANAAAVPEYRVAAAALTTLVMDRWGVDWARHFPRAAADLEPGKALVWATGAATEADALGPWHVRMAAAVAPRRTQSLADMSPVRVTPRQVAPLGPGPMDNYSPHSYTISARYEPDRGTVSGRERLQWQNGEGVPVDTLYFNLLPNAEQFALFGGAISVSQVTVDGKPVDFTAQYLDLTVPLGRAVQPGEQAIVELEFITRLPGRLTPRVFGQQDGRFNLAHWFPILAVLDERGWNLQAMPLFPGEPYSENSRFAITLDVPRGTLVAATGRQTARREDGDRWVYTYDAPNVKDWIATGGTDLTEVTRTAEGVTIRVVDRSATLAGTTAEETERALRFFTEQFGPYPYPDLVVVTCCAWLEYPGLFYTQVPSGSDADNWWRTVLYHELAHQWFYGVVGNDQYSEAWLDEGFARYGERFALKAFGMEGQTRDIRDRRVPFGALVNSSTVTFNATGGYTQTVYDQGALVLEDLEALLGPEEFRKVLREYVARYRFKTATTADFVRTAEAVSGRDLRQFFEEHKVRPEVREPYRPSVPLGSVQPVR